jgi:shikimate kinase
MNIYLTGYRCTGKTEAGKYLSKRLNRQFIDTDAQIVEKYNMSVKQIVQAEGWHGFREKEKSVIRHVSTFDNHVVATGGGVILDPENIRHIKKSGISIWLMACPETIIKRLQQDPNTHELRPCLTSNNLSKEVKQTLSQRNQLYEKISDFAVNTDNIKIEQAGDLIINFLNYRTGLPV